VNDVKTELVYPDLSTDKLTNEDALKEPSIHQLNLLEDKVEWTQPVDSYRDKLIALLSSDLDFHGYDTSYASHDFHPFPAKFPPQLPRKFIQYLTQPGDVVLDPMMGSGTTVVEAYLAGRVGVGVDIDPLAKLITQVKTTAIDTQTLYQVGASILESATIATKHGHEELLLTFKNSLDQKTLEFIDYWFALETQVELVALAREIQKISDNVMRAFFELALSSCVITKSGGVSLAFDLAHTRPHRAKIVYSHEGRLVLGEELLGDNSPRIKLLTKNLRSALVEFRKRYQQNAKSMVELNLKRSSPHLYHGDAQRLPLDAESVDLIVTSPPYASNAIDYMRAHKFSLVWLGYPVDLLGETRRQCIGGEGLLDFQFEDLPPYTTGVVAAISKLDLKKGQVLLRYYSEMARVLQEMYRVLKAGKAAILVVASSMIRNRDSEIGACLAEIGKSIGFEVPKVGIRRLDRNRRMLPAGKNIDHASQIQNRMHEEFVIGFYKP
jgi:DNA modification methylase